jgi:DNA helicase HerA-like ATPase
VVAWSDAQAEALYAFYRRYGSGWISAVIKDEQLEGFQEGTIGVVKRRLLGLLGLRLENDEIASDGVFDMNAGKTTLKDICAELEAGKAVIIDTSSFSGPSEILIGSMIATEILSRYRRYKSEGVLEEKPTISIVLEEAPRVLGKEVLEKGSNIFSTIAREGRKFKVGLMAITQLPSLIPRQILANMNTKIIMGLEMAPERDAIINSASQDLSEYGRNIASLDKGEAIISSNFTKFAVPVRIPLFEDLVAQTKNEFISKKYIRNNMPGIGLE